MGSLRKINLSFNQIATISGFTALNGPHSRLSHVDLRGNRIASLEELQSLSRCPLLRFLSFQMEPRSQARGNPVCSLSGYRSYAFKKIPSLFSLDGFDINMQPVHESEDLDSHNPSLAPYTDFLSERGVRRGTVTGIYRTFSYLPPILISFFTPLFFLFGVESSDTPLIDQVLQRRRPLSARHKGAEEKRDGGEIDSRKEERRHESLPPKSRSDHEERLSKLEAQLAKRLSARQDARANRSTSVRQDARANRTKLRSYDSESSVSIDEDLGSTTEADDTSVTSSRDGHKRVVYRPREKARNNEPEAQKAEAQKSELPQKVSTYTQGMQTDPPPDFNIESHPTVKALYEEIGSLQKELSLRDEALLEARSRETSSQEPVRALQTSIQQATVREHGLREALAREKELVQRQTHQITSLHHQVNEFSAQLRTARECADKAEDQRRELQSAAESLRAVCDAEKAHSAQKDAQIERLTVLLRERHGEELSNKGKEGELQVELERVQVFPPPSPNNC